MFVTLAKYNDLRRTLAGESKRRQEAEQQVDNTNEAFAFASCKDCVTVAVSFQVVVIVGQADVVVPQNVSAAVNYDCFECITAAVAKQLVVTVYALPGQEQLVALNDIWADLAAFAQTIPTLSLQELMDQLEDFEEQIKQVLTGAVEEAPPVPTPSTDATAAPDDPSASPTATPTDDGSAEPSPSDSSSPSPTDTATPAEEPSVAETTPVAEESPTS